MDKKSIVYVSSGNYISASSWLFNVRQKDIKDDSTKRSKFDLEDTGKLVAIVAASEMTREYLIKQKISPDHINI